MKDKIAVKKGVWYNSEMMNRKVRITLDRNHSVEKTV
jgi:hypothetical protein